MAWIAAWNALSISHAPTASTAKAEKLRMSKMKFVAASAAALCLALLTSCGSSGGSSSIIPPVSAQSTYSNASVSGTYSIVLNGYSGSPSLGTVKADGNGNFTSGSLTQYGSNNNPTAVCIETFTGTYSIQSNASGIATINLTTTYTSGITPSDVCFLSGTYTYGIQTAQQGASFFFVQSGTTGGISFGSAAKQ